MGGHFEALTMTQKRQFKYFIKFWHEWSTEKQRRKVEKEEALEHAKAVGKSSRSSSKWNRSRASSKIIDAATDDSKVNEDIDELAVVDEQTENANEDEKGHFADEQTLDDEETKEQNVKAPADDGDAEAEQGTEAEHHDEDDLDLYAADEFEYESDDDRPRGQVLLEFYRNGFERVSGPSEDAALHVAIPTDVEQLIIRDCKNRSGELAHWVGSVLRNVPRHCPVDWLGLENNNLQDRDIHRICAGLFQRTEQSHLVGLSLSRNVGITDKAIQVLLQTVSKKCHGLQFLKLSGCSKLSNKTCQYLLDFFAKTHADDSVRLCFVDLADCGRINDKGVNILNQVFKSAEYMPLNVVVRFNVAGTGWREQMAEWSKNIILRPPKRK